MKYQELCDKMYKYHNDNIFYAFSNQQFEEGCEKMGLTPEEGAKVLYKGDFGDFGTKEAFMDRKKFFDNVENEIRKECKPEEIFDYEWWNHESGLTGNCIEALNIVRIYFPDYTPTQEHLKELQEKFWELNG